MSTKVGMGWLLECFGKVWDYWKFVAVASDPNQKVMNQRELFFLVGCVSTSSALDQLCSAMFSMFIRWHQFSVAKCSWNRTEGVGTYRLYLAADMCCTINGATNLQVSKLIIYDIQTYIHTFRWGIVMWSLLVEVCQLRAAAASGAVKRMRLKHGAKS